MASARLGDGFRTKGSGAQREPTGSPAASARSAQALAKATASSNVGAVTASLVAPNHVHVLVTGRRPQPERKLNERPNAAT
jgi:REP element-mobilizing transposase RayT